MQNAQIVEKDKVKKKRSNLFHLTYYSNYNTFNCISKENIRFVNLKVIKNKH